MSPLRGRSSSAAACRLVWMAALLRAAAAEPFREAARRTAACDAGDAPAAAVQLLQTSVGLRAVSGGAVAAAAAGGVQATDSFRAAASGAAAQGALLGGGLAVGEASASGRVASRDAGLVYKPILVFLPLCAFVLALVAICMTVALEKGPPSWESEGYKKGDLRLPPRLLASAAGGRAAEGLLQLQGEPAGFGAPKGAPYGYQRPAAPARTALAEAPATRGGAAGGGGFMAPPPRPPLALEGPGQLQVTIPYLPEGEPIGLNLSEEGLVVESFADPVATGYGFRIGDRILFVNDSAVTTQDDFMLLLKAAREENASFGEPVVFTLWRCGTPGGLSDWSPWIGLWEFEGETRPPGPRRFALRPSPDALLLHQGTGNQALQGVMVPDAQEQSYEAVLRTAGGEPRGVLRLRRGDDGALAVRWGQTGLTVLNEEFRAKRVQTSKRPPKAACSC